jgi:sugar phosphate permease
VYIVTVLFIRSDFLVAILGYLPALIFVGEAFLLAHLRKKTPAFLVGFLGVCVMLFAAVTQQAKLGIDPRYFDHNALYHFLQAIALFMVFLAARETVNPGESIN